MESRGLVIDTGIFIEYLRAGNKRNTVLFSLPDDRELFISSVTLYELYMGATTEEKVKDIKLLTDDLTVLEFDSTIAIKASEIYHQLRKLNKMIEFRDIFIAATCIVHDMPLKTLNLKDYNRIDGLTFEK